MKQRPSPTASIIFLCLEGNFLEPLDPLEGISGHDKVGIGLFCHSLEGNGIIATFLALGIN